MEKSRILLVDDTESVLEQEKEALRDLAVDIACARDAKEAMKALIAGKPHLVLLDLILPDMPGESVIRFIRSREDLRHTSIILVTARGDDEGLAKCAEMGCGVYVTKPFERDDLAGKVTALLEEKGLLH